MDTGAEGCRQEGGRPEFVPHVALHDRIACCSDVSGAARVRWIRTERIRLAMRGEAGRHASRRGIATAGSARPTCVDERVQAARRGAIGCSDSLQRLIVGM
ncbi:hypothetical protein FOC34_06325 [Burkholderia multivorans]|nr:hypothetical protein FOC34_06325 [Burkholderia multivorans]